MDRWCFKVTLAELVTFVLLFVTHTVSLVPSHLQNQGAHLTAARTGKLKFPATDAAKLPATKICAPLLCFCIQFKKKLTEHLLCAGTVGALRTWG